MISNAETTLKGIKNAPHTDFFAHGMGLITHEVPFLMTNHPVAYEGVDAAHPLEPGMVLSVETTMLHPTRGFIKIEDTITINDDRPRTARRSRPRLEQGREVGLLLVFDRCAFRKCGYRPSVGHGLTRPTSR